MKQTNVTKTFLPDIDLYKQYIDRIFESGWVTNKGELVIELENRLAAEFGVKHVIATANGTLALQVLYKALELKGEVITTPFSFVATTSSIVWEGLKPIFADIDPRTFCIDPKEAEKKITSDTSAIVAVHVYGNPCDIEAFEFIAKKYGLYLIFDAAHAFYAGHKGRSVVQYGHASILSFHATKLFHTIEGGAIITNDDALAKKVRLMINFGISGIDSVACLGINAKMNEFQAAMGLCMLDYTPANILNRQDIFMQYQRAFEDNPAIQLQQITPDSTINFSYFPIVLTSENKLIEIRKALNERGIYPRRYFYPSLESLHYLPDRQTMPVSSSLASRVLCLPIYEGLEPEKVQEIIMVIDSQSRASSG